jgi:hypothetical protein
MQISEKYKEKFDVSSEAEGNFRTRRQFLDAKGLRWKCGISPYIFQVVASLPTKVLLLLAVPTLAQTVQYNKAFSSTYLEK